MVAPNETSSAAKTEGPFPTSLKPERLRTLGIFVDNLVTLDVQTREQHLGLYRAAFELQGEPLCLRAAKAILQGLKSGRLNTALSFARTSSDPVEEH